MLRNNLLWILIIILCVGSAAAEDLSRQRQLEIVKRYLMAIGQSEHLAAFSLDATVPDSIKLPMKCGTPAVTEFVLNRDKLDSDILKTLGTLVDPRPTGFTDSIDSPSGRFRIHFFSSGQEAVYSADYADSVAAIYDAVYDHIVNTLGFTAPPTDGFYPEGGDDAFDVYLMDLGGFYYGLTQLDSTIDAQIATAYQILDNDYQEIPAYRNRPLDAVRVTCAHEFFHVIQFGIDYSDFAIYPGSTPGDITFGTYWMEMSATWMEEEMYDNINDYYFYLWYFFNFPYSSIQQTLGSWDLHPYASVVFPIFLSQRFDRSLIRDIWLRCRDLGANADHFPEAAAYVIDSFTNGAESFASAFHEFTVWNYFTGSRAQLAPDGIGYEERAIYDEFLDHMTTESDSVIAVNNNYEDPISVDPYANLLSPDHNAAFYLKLDELQTLAADTTYWNCVDGAFPACNDSAEVVDTTLGYDIMHIDTVFEVGLDLDPDFPNDWGVSYIYQLEDPLDSAEVELSTLPASFNDLLEFDYDDLSRFRSMVFVISPASGQRNLYRLSNGWYNVGYQISTAGLMVDSTLVNLPAAILAPYPNPAVVSELDGSGIMFKFQVPTDSASFPLYGERYSGSSPSLYVDIYNVAGERVRNLSQIVQADERSGTYWTEWDLKNENGDMVASGVYIAYARLFGDSEQQQLLEEDKAKVLVIR